MKTLTSREEFPFISIVIPTLNSESTLRDCLASVDNQRYAKEKIETLIVDGGSKDNTLSISKNFGCRIIRNPFVTHPRGRPLGIAAAKGDLILCLDSDNILDSNEWLRRMVAPFQDPDIFASEPLYYTARDSDSLLTKYCSLIGGDDPIAIYLGFYDRFSAIAKGWTESPVRFDDMGDFYKIEFLNPNMIPPLGSNGFLVRADLLKKVDYDPFLHVEVVRNLVRSFNLKLAKVKIGIVHTHSSGFGHFFQKKRRRLRRRICASNSNLLWDEGFSPKRVQKLVLQLLFLRPIFDMVQGFLYKPSKAWLLHPPLSFGTAFVYAQEFVLTILGESLTPYETT